ncbi:hypothetical protein FGADI_10898 [Fusarium gaditjirri]|uniref:Modin n=1 Tax=Fusarium gaditjirri TaxID=282569 RepID=A0A8H4SW98_9HYPO|nr:hypothetical protein FGADI_10898 [Fusarium gaditjirri]
MASKTKPECLLNTTECMLETITSILSEIQEQNSEYNWDPLTFIFTAIIGVIAIAFAALTAFQAFLTAGPGRTKSGAYAIGPWSRLNYRKFDWSEMRFRTVSSTPILTAMSLDFTLLEESDGNPISSHEKSGGLRKGQEDYFPATWLALLTHLSLDYTTVWGKVKLTGADFIPSEFSAVLAYGSMRFVAALAMILSQGYGRLTFDRESGLLRVRYTSFNLVFRQHPLLGVTGFFEIYGGIRSLGWHRVIRRRLLEAHGQMNITNHDRVESLDGEFIDADKLLTFNDFEGGKFKIIFMKSVQQKCPHRNQKPEPACVNLLFYLNDYHSDFFTNGPISLLAARIPSAAFIPVVFPHKKAKLRERLDTLLLQSRSWGLKSLASCDMFPGALKNIANGRILMIDRANSWAKSKINPDINELELDEEAYERSSECLSESPTQDRKDDRIDQNLLLNDLNSIDLWLDQIESQVLCRKLILSVVGDGVRQIINASQQQPISEAVSHNKNATAQSSDCGLEGKLRCFLEAIKTPEGFNCLHRVWGTSLNLTNVKIKHETYAGLERIWDIWQREEPSLEGAIDDSEVGFDGRKKKSYAWKLPDATVHPLDDILIYRAVLITLIYSLTTDSSVLMDEEFGQIVPII